MLAAPALKEIEGVTIFADDTLWYKFYPVPQYPRVRLDQNGNPVFLLVKYAFSDEDRIEDPSLPSGGGYLNFDIVFDTAPEVLEQVKVELQALVDAEWSRLQNGTPEEKALPGVAGTNEPPAVELGSPTWTSGQAALDAPQSTALVNARVAEAAPSLLSGNIAVFSMDLTEAGATFMEKVLVGEDGEDGSDLTMLQVTYDLTFWARLPPANIHVTADSEKTYTYIHKTMEGRGVDHCTTYDFQNTKTDAQTAQLTGVIQVSIDDSSGALTDEVKLELTNYALDLVKSMIESSFFTDQPPIPIAPDGQPGSASNGNTKKYLREQSSVAGADISFELEQRSVVEWPIHPQATLETFFRDMDEEALKQYVKVIDLNDDFFKHLNLDIRVFADFDDEAISVVEVQVHYEGRDENGERQEKEETFTFTDAEPQRWSPSLIGKERSYQYRYRIGFKDRGFGPFSEWETSTSPDLNLAIPAPGRVRVDVVAGDVDFTNMVDFVHVVLAYEDPEAGIPLQEHMVRLTASAPAASYERLIYDFWRQPLRYQRRFRLKSGEVMEDDQWQETISRNQIIINQPFEDVLKVNLLPVGDGWDDVVQVIVDLRYNDIANSYKVEESLMIKSKDEFRTWKVLPKNRSKRDFEYRVTASYKDGRFEQTDWKRSLGEETVPIEVRAQPKLKIFVMPDNLDMEAAPLTEVTLRYQAAGINEEETFVFSNGNKVLQTWTISVPAGAPIDYTYQVTHNPVGMSPVVLPEVHEDDTWVVLPPYRAPQTGTLTIPVLPTLVDFSATPIVVVDLKYDDEVNGVHASESLTFSDKSSQVWNIEVKDIHRKLFGYKITYFTAEGAEQTTEMKFIDTPRIIIPKSQSPV